MQVIVAHNSLVRKMIDDIESHTTIIKHHIISLYKDQDPEVMPEPYRDELVIMVSRMVVEWLEQNALNEVH